MTARGDSLGCSRNPGSNYYTGFTHQSMIDLGADDAAKVSAFHSLWVGKAGGKLLRGSPPLSGASVLSASRFEPLLPCMGLFLSRSFGTPAHLFIFHQFLCSRAGAVKVGRRIKPSGMLCPLPGHTLTAS